MDDLLATRWRLAWIISESFRQGGYHPRSFEDFAVSAERWASRMQPGGEAVPMPYPWERDGVQAELAIRDFAKTGTLAPRRNHGH